MGSLHSAPAGCSLSILSAHLEKKVPSRGVPYRPGVKCIRTRVEIPIHENADSAHSRPTLSSAIRVSPQPFEVAGRTVCVSRRVHPPGGYRYRPSAIHHAVCMGGNVRAVTTWAGQTVYRREPDTGSPTQFHAPTQRREGREWVPHYCELCNRAHPMD